MRREPGFLSCEEGTSAKVEWRHKGGVPVLEALLPPPSDGALRGSPRCEELHESISYSELAPEKLESFADEHLDRGADLGRDLDDVDQHAVCPIGKATGLEMLDHLLGLELGHSVGETDDDRCARYVGPNY